MYPLCFLLSIAQRISGILKSRAWLSRRRHLFSMLLSVCGRGHAAEVAENAVEGLLALET